MKKRNGWSTDWDDESNDLMLEASFFNKLSEIGYTITDQIIDDLIIDETFHHNIPLERTVCALFCHLLLF